MIEHSWKCGLHNRLKFLFSFRVSYFSSGKTVLPKIKVLIYITESFKIVHIKKTYRRKTFNAMKYIIIKNPWSTNIHST